MIKKLKGSGVPELRTRRLVLRQLELSDYPAWLRSQEARGPKRDKFDVAPLPLEKRTRKHFRQRVARQKRQAKKDVGYMWSIFVRRSGELVGFVDVCTILREPYQMANLGYFMINAYRGQGYALEALKAIVPAALKDLGYHRLEASMDLDNRASIALAKRLGLYREGIKKHYWFQNGRWEDQVIFMATPELFPAIADL